MRYKLLNTTFSADTKVFDVVNHEAETDKDGNVTKEAETVTTPTDKYACAITMTFKDTESQNEGTFDKIIIVESDNKQTGFEVDEQREKAINLYISDLNK